MKKKIQFWVVACSKYVPTSHRSLENRYIHSIVNRYCDCTLEEVVEALRETSRITAVGKTPTILDLIHSFFEVSKIDQEKDTLNSKWITFRRYTRPLVFKDVGIIYRKFSKFYTHKFLNTRISEQPHADGKISLT